jgi:hypothetical protein
MNMLRFLKTFFLGYEPSPQELPPQTALPFQPVFAQVERRNGIPVELAQRGWRAYRFTNSPIIIALPPQLEVRIGADGILHASVNSTEPAITATLLRDFVENPNLAYDFVTDQAWKRGVPSYDVFPYRCLYDPTQADPNIVTNRVFIIALPGAVVILTLQGTRTAGATPLLNEVRQWIPHLVWDFR